MHLYNLAHNQGDTVVELTNTTFFEKSVSKLARTNMLWIWISLNIRAPALWGFFGLQKTSLEWIATKKHFKLSGRLSAWRSWSEDVFCASVSDDFMTQCASFHLRWVSMVVACNLRGEQGWKCVRLDSKGAAAWCDALPSPVGQSEVWIPMVFRFQSHQSISFSKGDTVTSPQFGRTTKLNQQTTACVPQTVYFPPAKDWTLCFSKATLAHSRIKRFHDSSGQSSLCPQWIPAWQEGNMQNTWESWAGTRRKHTATAKTSPLAENTHSSCKRWNLLLFWEPGTSTSLTNTWVWIHYW